ncbi:MAG: AAA family ATPase [Methylococcaceae bacterium]
MTISQEEIHEILAPLDAYYAATPLEFSIGLQNFQSIRQYTKIPIAPITLIYRQNSAGKSAIHDALIFLYDFLSNKSIPQDSLDRWANRKRINSLLSNGYIGRAEDVIISINVYGWNSWDTEASPINTGKMVLSTLWNEKSKEPHKFQLRFHFAYGEHSGFHVGWFIRELHLIFGADEFIHYQHLEVSDENQRGCLSINIKHPLFGIIGQLCGKTFDQMAEDCEFCNGEFEMTDKWLRFKNVGMSDCALEWIYDANFNGLDCHESELSDEYHTANTLRDLLSGMIEIPSAISARFAKLESVPPLRPVPTKSEACFRISSSDRNTDKAWKSLSIEIRDEQIGYLGNSLRPHIDKHCEDGGVQLDYVNHALQHPLFLNTGYEVVGECRFLLSAQKINEIKNDTNDYISYWAQFVDSEVTLKLKYVPENFTVEIEDVGVGISQIIPVLCTIYNAYRSYIHQPELHLHPKQQSHLGDVFIERINDELYGEWRIEHDDKPERFFFIETHSEHILLRILRRIRETNRSDIKNKLFGFTADQLCVLYVDKDKNGDSQVMRLRVAENGDFIDRWPHGFFTERNADLFDE